ncbi:MAG: chromate transporter [Hydrogenophaga sp.]|jgi:chromate transporter|nr:chromate transporter [Hydrogenophaga sp.]MDP1894380.1 chromate transporter [Hydrogenophaga sp.]MDP2093549.1 chromate transporter [Hydrogenophaga sp.]MDP3923301.1 chromate transporter [Hydrogenophaga sp.]
MTKISSISTEPLAPPNTLWDLFWSFSLLALQGFGGVMAITQRELVERKRWLSRQGFLEDWAVAQILPGPNVANLAVMLGDRFMGSRGALVSVAGLFVFPFVIVVVLAIGFMSLSHLPQVQGALRGMGLVVAALIMTTAFKLIPALGTHPGGRIFCALAGLATVICVVLLKWSLLWVLLLVGGASCLWTYRCLVATALAKGGADER